MARMMLAVVAAVLLLCGCSTNQTDPKRTDVAIDWVDFVKLDGHSYTESWEYVIKDPGRVTNAVVGEVKFKVADVVTNSSYHAKDGDAAFLEIGTKLYRVEGFSTSEVLAVKNAASIGGYRLYVEENYAQTALKHYKDIAKDKVERIELFHQQDIRPYKTLTGVKLKRFIQLLDSGEDKQNYNPQFGDRDSEDYEMVFYTDDPIAYAFILYDDGAHVYFTPWNYRIVDQEIRALIQPVSG
ncbi:hypothetical protein GZH47_21990 [Paenibacillus rhizovicinus]|uniref:DUF3298 domain-containing protein n=1 Tax=Paenibacillus rhizovicinus TaxID=2704463 RepID=A0A6C0P4C8_9BACL|nr:hypothetical protein [Paenibacillus rhizovicinus]QHW33191.1 hypothetical protein GZH47_21990 [Paenibacillus rhizovicinus]